MGKRTPLYETHVAAGARMVDFGGWDMPVHYGSQIEEHHAVRRDAGLFDVSHMTVLDLAGSGTRDFLRKLLANDIGKLQEPGRALYSCMLNEQAGIIDDLIVYRMRDDGFRMVVNAATHDKDVAWIRRQGEDFGVQVNERDFAMIAVQGPNARIKTQNLLPVRLRDRAVTLKPFTAALADEFFVARTGYTGEDGFEIMLRAPLAAEFWQALTRRGVKPCGLGARDTLRLEAALNLYGTDMDEHVTPLESGLDWTVAWEPAERDFIGREALQAQRDAGPQRKLVGLLLDDSGVLRSHQKVLRDGIGQGEITSGSFGPTLGRSMALARVNARVGERVQVEIRGRLGEARIVKTPFVRHGKVLVK